MSGNVDIGGASLYYEVTGAGSPVVLLHGVNLDHHVWDAQVAPLAHAHTVVRYDLRGAGRDGVGYRIRPRHAEDLKALLDHLELVRVSLLGLSLGAGVAIDFAIAYPSTVRALILVSPSLEGPAEARLGDVTTPTQVRLHKADGDEVRVIDANPVSSSTMAVVITMRAGISQLGSGVARRASSPCPSSAPSTARAHRS